MDYIFDILSLSYCVFYRKCCRLASTLLVSLLPLVPILIMVLQLCLCCTLWIHRIQCSCGSAYSARLCLAILGYFPEHLLYDKLDCESREGSCRNKLLHHSPCTHHFPVEMHCGYYKDIFHCRVNRRSSFPSAVVIIC